MIEVTRPDGRKIILNAELILSIEETPDTVITLTSGIKILVTERINVIIDSVVEYKRKIHQIPVLHNKDSV
jgi:flagellar protein FlbD